LFVVGDLSPIFVPFVVGDLSPKTGKGAGPFVVQALLMSPRWGFLGAFMKARLIYPRWIPYSMHINYLNMCVGKKWLGI